MKPASVLLAVAVILTGCGREERAEAGRLSRTLAEKRAAYAKANSLESEMVSSARAWCGGITANGAGKGVELEQNAAVAAELAKSAADISAELGNLRQALEDQTLKKEKLQTLRNDLLAQLIKRQRALQDMRALLVKSSSRFQDFRRDKSFAGDSYPGEIGTLSAMLEAYKAPGDAVGAALNTLKSDYNLQ